MDEKQVLRKLGHDKNTIVRESKKRMNEDIDYDEELINELWEVVSSYHDYGISWDSITKILREFVKDAKDRIKIYKEYEEDEN